MWITDKITNHPKVSLSVIIILLLTSLTVSAIAVEAYNNNDDTDINKKSYKQDNYKKFQLLVFCLSVICVVIASPLLYYAMIKPIMTYFVNRKNKN